MGADISRWVLDSAHVASVNSKERFGFQIRPHQFCPRLNFSSGGMHTKTTMRTLRTMQRRCNMTETLGRCRCAVAGREGLKNVVHWDPRALSGLGHEHGDTQGTNTHARGTRKKHLRKKCGKLRNCGKLREIAGNCGPRSPPPVMVMQGQKLWLLGARGARAATRGVDNSEWRSR